eukprot:1876963-Amphidinium_carterae.7
MQEAKRQNCWATWLRNGEIEADDLLTLAPFATFDLIATGALAKVKDEAENAASKFESKGSQQGSVAKSSPLGKRGWQRALWMREPLFLRVHSPVIGMLAGWATMGVALSTIEV